jgi:hypothetical protein
MEFRRIEDIITEDIYVRTVYTILDAYASSNNSIEG